MGPTFSVRHHFPCLIIVSFLFSPTSVFHLYTQSISPFWFSLMILLPSSDRWYCYQHCFMCGENMSPIIGAFIGNLITWKVNLRFFAHSSFLQNVCVSAEVTASEATRFISLYTLPISSSGRWIVDVLSEPIFSIFSLLKLVNVCLFLKIATVCVCVCLSSLCRLREKEEKESDWATQVKANRQNWLQFEPGFRQSDSLDLAEPQLLREGEDTTRLEGDLVREGERWPVCALSFPSQAHISAP